MKKWLKPIAGPHRPRPPCFSVTRARTHAGVRQNHGVAVYAVRRATIMRCMYQHRSKCISPFGRVPYGSAWRRYASARSYFTRKDPRWPASAA